MDHATAIAIVRSVANGVHPETGEMFTAEHVYNNPAVIRALFAAVKSMEVAAKRERKARDLPARTGEPWSEDEDRKLLGLFDGGRGLKEIVQAMERTEVGVKARLIKYGRLAS